MPINSNNTESNTWTTLNPGPFYQSYINSLTSIDAITKEISKDSKVKKKVKSKRLNRNDIVIIKNPKIKSNKVKTYKITSININSLQEYTATVMDLITGSYFVIPLRKLIKYKDGKI